MSQKIKIIECPRDAMQGIHKFIPTDHKIQYINKLLSVGFDTIDFGSFVSPKAIPQLRDTAEVLNQLDLSQSKSKLLAIVANIRGAVDACQFDEINYLGFPFSISETFQQRNTNSSMEESIIRVEQIQNLCVQNDKQLVIYISMGFGNPYGDPWNLEIVETWVSKIKNLGVEIISLADTIGEAKPADIAYLFQHLIPTHPDIELGAHLHASPSNWKTNVSAAIDNGCTRIDGAIKGFGGCPMAKDDLVGNMATENILSYLNEKNIETELNLSAFSSAMQLAVEIFPSHNGV